MKIIRFFLYVVVLTSIAFHLRAQTAEGQLVEINVPAPSLANNIVSIPTEQPIVIYLPPSYTTSNTQYPVVYFLPGFGTPIIYFTRYGVFQGFLLQNSMDKLIREGAIKEMIVVIPNGVTFMMGSFYVNSPVTGNWEDFIVKDVVGYVDSHYRTLPHAGARGIAGHSMGGFGALNLAMLHPDVFGATYALCPGLFDENGLSKNIMFASGTTIRRYLKKEREFEVMTEDEAIVAFLSFMAHLAIVEGDDDRAFEYAYGAAFSPNPHKKAPYIDYPYRQSGTDIVLDSVLWEKYRNGFGGLADKVKRYHDNLLRLKAIMIDYGINDYYEWIPEGCVYFGKLLDGAEIPHTLIAFEGGHSNKVRERIEEHMLPMFSRTLQFDTRTLQ